MEELWKSVLHFEGLYEVSSLGNVKSLRQNKIMKHNVDKGGYHRVPLYKNGKKLYKAIHRLVAQAFIPNIDNKPQVNHIDSDRSNNNVNNLEWVTSSENNTHAYKFGKNYSRFGVQNGKSQPIIQYDLNGNFIKEWESLNLCADTLDLQESCISLCCSGKRNSTGGFKFKKKGEK